MTLVLGELGERLGDPRRIAVLRGGGIGDLVMAMPAIESLKTAYPLASITLIGAPSHRGLLEGRPGPIDEVAVMPPMTGLEDGEVDEKLASAFRESLQQRRFDVVVQMHGGGRYSNAFSTALGAPLTVGSRTPDAARLTREVPFRYWQHETLRALEVAAAAGAPPATLEPHLTATEDEVEEGARCRRDIMADAPGPLVVVHPGARDARRQWPPERFGQIAQRVVSAGGGVAVVGSSADTGRARQVVETASARCGAEDAARIQDLAGELDLPALVGLLAVADAFVGNDSGPRHVAQALGCPTVAVYWCGNVINAGPLARRHHRPLVGWITHCPVCGKEQAQADAGRCEHDASFVADVPVVAVYAELDDMVRTSASASSQASRKRASA